MVRGIPSEARLDLFDNFRSHRVMVRSNRRPQSSHNIGRIRLEGLHHRLDGEFCCPAYRSQPACMSNPDRSPVGIVKKNGYTVGEPHQEGHTGIVCKDDVSLGMRAVVAWSIGDNYIGRMHLPDIENRTEWTVQRGK